MLAVAGTNAVAWAVGAGSSHSPLPMWPAFAFGALAVCAFYCVIAAIVRLWPFRRLRSVPELLDDFIREGRDARSRITYEELAGSRPLVRLRSGRCEPPTACTIVSQRLRMSSCWRPGTSKPSAARHSR